MGAKSFFLFFLFNYFCQTSNSEEYAESIYFKDEEVRHIRDLSVQDCIDNIANKDKGACDDDVLVSYLTEIQVITPESIIGIPIADFDSACRTVESSLKKLKKYFRNCTASPGLYVSLINGVKTLDHKLCRDAKFYAAFERYYQCFHDLDNDYDSCDGSADWNEGEDKTQVCKIYQGIVDCYFIKTAKVCGKKGAKILKEVMTETIDCTLPFKCSVGSNPSVKNAMPEKYMDTVYKNKASTSNLEEFYHHQKITFALIIIIFIFL